VINPKGTYMKKNLVHATLSLFMLIALTTSVYPQWTQTNWQESNSFFNLYTDQDRVFARTWDSLNGGRMFFTADNGENWTQIRPADSNFNLLSIVMLSNGILAGTWNGFYESTLDGTIWNAVTPAGIPADSAILSIAMINSELYAGARGTIYKSVNNGVSWIEVKSGIPSNSRITSFIAKESAIFAGSDTSGVFMTTNAGASWTAVNSGIADKHIIQLAVMGSRLFAVTLKGVFISDNNGVNWTANISGLNDINCFVAVNNQLFAGTDSSEVFLSEDNGATWTSFNSGMPNSTRVWSLGLSSGNLFAGTSCGVWRTPISLVEFTITASASVGGTISPEGATAVYEYSSKTFAIAPATGYRISDVVVDGTSAGAVASYTFLNVTANHTISAVFTEVPTYTITASAGDGGTISPSGTVTVSDGSSPTFTISPLPGYAVATVTVDGSPVGAVSTYTFTNVSANHTIAATFVSAPYTITASAGSGGSISPSGTVTVAAGSSQTFTIAPSSGYEVLSVLIDGVSAGALYSYTFSSVTSNHTISASFSPLTKNQINCGGSASSPYTADQYYSGGRTYSVTSAITTTGVTDPAPQAVYRTERYGSSTYTIPNLTNGASYMVRLHFAEIYWTATGRRIFNVAINGTTVLSNYDIYAETGARYKAVVKEYTATANASGQIVIQFTTVTDNAKISGIEIIKMITNIPPAIATAASADPNPVTGSTTELSVLGSDDKGESNLTYTWAAIGTPPAAVTFSTNGTNAAKTATATFTRAGSYSLQATVTDAEGMSVTSSVTMTVNQTLTSIMISPASALVAASATQQFSATGRDQFASALTPQPAFTWGVNGGGTVDADGLFTAGTAPGTFTVTATSGSVSASANVTVNTAPTIVMEAAADTDPVTATTTALSVLGADDNGESNLTYTWTTAGAPPAAVDFSANGTNAAKNTIAAFSKAGAYTFQVTVKDQGNLTATSSVSVTVSQTLTSIAVSPTNAAVNALATQQFTAVASDQFAVALTPQPAFIWSASGGGTVDANGLFTAGTTSGNYTVTAASGSVSATAGITVNTAPTIATAASASPNPVAATTTALSVLGADDNGEPNLTYTWTTNGTPPAPVMFSINGTNMAKATTVIFTNAGNYLFQVTVTDQGGLTATSSIAVTVDQAVTSIVVSPASASVNGSATLQFSAIARDQFVTDLSPQPVFAWSVSGGGTIDVNGLFTAGTTEGTFTVTASSGSVNAAANITVVIPNAAPTIATAASASPNPVTAATTSLSVLGADDHGESNLTYNWVTAGTPPAPVTFSTNGTNAAKNTTATFSKAGSYMFQVTVTDAGGLTAASTATVTVNQTLTSIALAPTSATVNPSATQQFTATGRDQFATALATQPTFTWSVSGGGTISSNGLFTAGTTAGGLYTITAQSSGVSGTASVTVAQATVYQINNGGSASSPFTADQYYSGGRTYSVSSTINTTGVTDPAPQSVYRTERYGTMTYTLPNLTPGASYKVRLHFAEIYWTATGRRRFNVTINGTTVLSNYDIYAETGARYKAVVKEYTATANSSGQIVIQFTTITDNAKIGGIEVIRQ
jgi:hypothetical protein